MEAIEKNQLIVQKIDKHLKKIDMKINFHT